MRLATASRSLGLLLLFTLAPLAAFGQAEGSNGAPIRWWHGAIVAGGVATVFLLDEPLQQTAQRGRTATGDRVASGFRQLGEPLVVYSASLGTWGVGLVRDDATLERTGARLTTSISLAAVLVHGGKLVFGRNRPNVDGQAFEFRPFSGLADKSFPSGHTAVAFALLTTLADDLDNSALQAGLYALAAGTGWSRINDNKHWASDVVLGAVVGIASSKLVSGRWILFGIETPSYLEERSGGTGVGEVAVGIGTGIALYYAASRIVKTLHAQAPWIAPSTDGGLLLGWDVRF